MSDYLQEVERLLRDVEAKSLRMTQASCSFDDYREARAALLAHIGTMLPRPLFDSQCRELCGALGWQGGTYHQVLDEVKRLKESDTSRDGVGEAPSLRLRRGETDLLRWVSDDITRLIKEGCGAWRSCSGCHELNEGHDTGPYSHTFRCALGHGCSECGGIGAVWDTTDYQALAALDHFAAPAEVPMPEPAAWQVWAGVCDMSPYWPVFKTEAEARDVAATIKSVTEVRPLFFAAPAPDHFAAPAEVPMPEAVGTRFDGTKLIKEADARTYGDAREAAGYARAGLSSAAVDVLTERQRQISVEGWTTEHDDRHPDGSLSMAAACYAAQAGTTLQSQEYSAAAVFVRVCWPWAPGWWKPSTPRRDLVKAGALILAEIERLDRDAQKGAVSDA
jgi:hypothetical protein